MKTKDFALDKMISKLIKLCAAELQLNKLPKISIVDTPTVGSDHSFGVFDGNTISVVSANRHPADVLRTLAHEIVHWKQQLSGQDMDGSTGSDTENEANAKAGEIMRKFGEKYPELFIL